jgi:hypothetical protein
MKLEEMLFCGNPFRKWLPHLDLSNSTYPSTIWEKSSASYARALAKYSVSPYDTLILCYRHTEDHQSVPTEEKHQIVEFLKEASETTLGSAQKEVKKNL